MKVLIDTNILLISIPSKSPYHDIILAFNRREYQLIITTPIFLEYEEILTNKAVIVNSPSNNSVNVKGDSESNFSSIAV